MMEFEQILKDNNITYVTAGQHRHCRTGWIQFDCPFCGQGTHKYHMGFNLEYHITNCWRCGGHSVIDTLKELLGAPFHTVKELLKDIPKAKVQQTIQTTGKLKLPDGLKPLQKQHKKYLKARGFNPAELETLWKLQGTTIHADLSWRLFIPIHVGDQIVSWTTRSISDNAQRRYIGASKEHEAINKTQVLYGEQYCRHAIMICEGPADVWKIGPGAVATMGLNFSAAQIEAMLKYPTRIICLDNEKKAQARAEVLADMLSVYEGNTFNVQLDSKDAGSATKKEINRLRKLIQT